MILDEEQVKSFNRFATAFVTANQYMSKAIRYPNKLIVINESNKLSFDFNDFTEEYQRKFILNNFELYCTSLFIAFKPRLVTFLKNEGITSYNFDCVFLLGDKRFNKTEKVKV
ncbi:hypothetical protein SAMN04487898_12658 [Pedobacter sp. ok626]|uniref:hypothetical protein n=1 Tax=Pedobacter sp. ok626 TaxID=1761882 RepID=UPI00088D4EBC|nr:hypothetical protein [Pedobacter sp. ok626]SDL85023.1 hypothetical protein SAMN04487898_12658 [Pedobacter sp. ok626]